MTVYSRTVGFAGRSVTVEARGQRATSVVEFLFGDFPPQPPPAPLVTLSAHSDDADQRLRVCRDSVALWEGVEDGVMASRLLGETGWELAKGSTDGLVLHAGALSWGDAGVLLPGPSGAGKTSLAASLVCSGFGYLSDELAYIPLGQDIVHGFGRPLQVRHPVIKTLEPFLAADASAVRPISQRSGAGLVHARALGADGGGTPAPLRFIVFPRHDPSGPCSVRRLTKGQTGLWLSENIVNIRLMQEKAFREIARLARSVPGVVLRFPDLDYATEEVLRLVKG